MKINEALLLFLGLLLAKLSGKLVSSMYSWSEYSFFLLYGIREQQQQQRKGEKSRGIELIWGSFLFLFFFLFCYISLDSYDPESFIRPTRPTNRIVYANGLEIRCNKPVNSIESYAELDIEYSTAHFIVCLKILIGKSGTVPPPPH